MSMEDGKSYKAILTPSLNDYEKYCICHRYASDVFCENAKCTFSGHGRVNMPCKFHPMETYLLDLSACPYCDSKCVEIFIPSVVSEDRHSRRMPHDEELKDCHAKHIIPYVSYERQPYVKEQMMLNDLYAQKLPKEEYNIWRERMQRRCIIVKKKHQLLVQQKASLSQDVQNVPKITMLDLEKMRDDLYEAGRFEKEWRRSTAVKSVDRRVMPKFEEIKEKPSPIETKSKAIQCSPISKAQMRLSNVTHETPKKIPQKSPLKKPDPKYTWYNPALTPFRHQKMPQFKENMDAIQQKVEALTLTSPQNSPARRLTFQPLQNSTPKNNATVIYYGTPKGQEQLQDMHSTRDHKEGSNPKK